MASFIKHNCIIIGSGVSGLAAGIRLAKMGYQVTVLEKNRYAGGKLSELQLGKYRFDKGPSLLTMPELIDELSEMAEQDKLQRIRLQNIARYFFDDGSVITANSNHEEFAKELNSKFGEQKEAVLSHLNKSALYYKVTAPVFLERGLTRAGDLFNLKTLKALLNAHRLPLFNTMNGVNKKKFRDKRTVQLFNRYATYNGSNPFKAPALLNIIPHLEFSKGAFLPKNGMHDITLHLLQLAKNLGVKILLEKPVSKIVVDENGVKGVECDGDFIPASIVLSDVDINFVYRHLLPAQYSPEKQLTQEKSSSAHVFFWGINKTFPQLDLHNVLFSNDYENEFKQIFEGSEPGADPSIYINITSKFCSNDAPKGCENWFVMVNVPHNKNGSPITYTTALRKNIVNKINFVLKTDIEKHIEVEDRLDPFMIEQQTSSSGGSLYGNASNSKFSAFLRHANFSSKIKGLYFAGGSVHPGGGIPLCLFSAKIVSELIREKNAR